ncbi:MAG TPA: hypothetical protein VGC66_14750 [Pyrinomonadaceae bacterium]
MKREKIGALVPMFPTLIHTLRLASSLPVFKRLNWKVESRRGETFLTLFVEPVR